MSWAVIMSALSTVQITCTSLRKPFGQSGRIGRSIIRAVRIARSVGRPSRLKKPPGILPAAYIRSSTSTVSGKKSAPSRASVRPCAVASTIVSPERMRTAPSACFASLPLSNVISRPPTVADTVVTRCVATAMCSSTLRGRWRFESATCGGVTRSNFHPPVFDLLSPQAQFLDQCPIALQVVSLQVVQEPAPAADELQQPAPGVVVLRVRAQVLGELVDPRGEERDLNLRRARIGLAAPVLRDDLLLRFLGEGQQNLLVDG